MDWIKRMNDAIAYIEDNLDSEIDYSEVAKFANCSAYHFQRVFSCIAGTSLAEYIRRRRLTMAAFDLQNGGMKVVDAAVKYGYESQSAFSRAFHTLHGVTPSEVKNTVKPLVSYPPIVFQISVKGLMALNYRIEKKEAMRIIGVSLTTTNDDGRNMQEIPDFWEQNRKSGMLEKIRSLSNKKPSGLFGVGVGLPDDKAAFRYYIAAATDQSVPEGMVEYTVPSLQWAIFTSESPRPNDWMQRIFAEWFPSSGYEYGEAYGLEGSTESGKEYIWIPVEKNV